MAEMTWRGRVVAARERGTFTEEEVFLANQSWMTCAVGEQHAAHPSVVLYGQYRSGALDEELRALGASMSCPDFEGFGFAVSRNDCDLAEKRLDQIEDRVLQLKREQVAP